MLSPSAKLLLEHFDRHLRSDDPLEAVIELSRMSDCLDLLCVERGIEPFSQREPRTQADESDLRAAAEQRVKSAFLRPSTGGHRRRRRWTMAPPWRTTRTTRLFFRRP